jgi:aminoglycoside 3-N-acetyltransferase
VGEAEAVAATTTPATVDSLRADLAGLGDLTGTTTLVHCSLSALGFVIGGAQAVAEALLQALGPTGTLVVPTHSGHLSDPRRWGAPAVPASWWHTIRDHMPAFDSALTLPRQMGAVAEVVRRHPAARRSAHPMVSFAAVGPQADAVTCDHQLAFGMGEGSPLARLYELDGRVLLLGVGHANDSSLHLAEHRATYPGKHVYREGSPVIVGGERRWVTYDELEGDTDDFEEVGRALAAAGLEPRGRVGAGTARLLRQRELVDHAAAWFTEHRGR